MAGVDYAFVSGVVTVFSGEQAAEIRVPLIDDMLDEPVETFLLVLGNPLGVSLDRLAAVGTIEDNDSQVGIDVVGATVPEGTVGDPVAVVGVVEFVVRLVDAESGLEAVSGKEVRFDYETVAGTATAGEDYVPVGGSGAIRPGNTTFTVAVDLVGDDAHEAHETFSLRVFNVVDAEPSSVSAQGSVVDDDVPVLWISGARGVEGDGEIVFRVGLAALRELTELVTFDYRTLDHGGSATPANLCGGLGVDYVRASGDDVAVTEDNSWEATVSVVICGDDGVVEGTDGNLGVETFGLLLEGVVGAKLPAQVSGRSEDNIGRGEILDPDAKPRVFVDNVTELEDAGEMVFLVQLIPEANFDVSVFVETVPGSAESPGDYSARAQWVTIGVGDASAEFSVTLIDDNEVEAVSETFDVVLSLPTDGAVLAVDADAVGTIIDDDGPPPVKIEAPPKVVEEGEVERFKVTLAWASPSRVSVTFRFDDVTTTSDDYTLQSPPSTVLTIPAGETEGYIDFFAIDDGVDEENFESFAVVLVTADGGIVDVLRRRAVGTIRDSNDPPTLTVADVTVEEGETAGFVLMLDGKSGLEIAVVVQTSDLNVGDVATAGQDYTAVPETTVVFDPGVTAKTVTVGTINDLLNEAAVETYRFNVAVAADRVGRVTLDGLPATGSITDNDDPPNVTVEATPVKVAEEAGEATFTVELSSPSGLEVTVTADTVDGTAQASTDYTALSDRVVSFEPCTGPVADCVTAQEVTVSVTGDTAVEGDETFSLELSAPVHATLGTPASATVTIVDDDLAVSVSAAEAFEGEDVVLTVSLNEETTEEVTVRFTTRDIIVAPQLKDPATSGADGDYTEVTEVDGIEVKIPADTLSVEVTVATRDDEEEERSEVFGVRLSSPSPGLLIEGNGRDALGTIHDNDTTISVADASATEGDAVTFTVSLSNPLTVPVVVGYATEPSTGDDAATPGPGTGGDYTAISVADAATATIAVGDTSATFDVQTTDDTDDSVDEADETFGVRLSIPPNQTIGSLVDPPTATGTIEDDDDAPTLSIDNPPAVTEGNPITFEITMDRESSRPVTFTATTRQLFTQNNQAATRGADFTSLSDDITIDAGDTSATFTVQTLPDELDEYHPEQFRVRLSVAPRYELATIAIRDGIGLIGDDDDAPELTVTADAADVTEGEIAHFTITLSASSGQEVTAEAVTDAGTATAGEDYQHVTRPVRFEPGATNRTFNVAVQTNDNPGGEPDEFFSVVLRQTTNAEPSQPARVTIIDDDVALSINNAAPVIEGDTLSFPVTLNTTYTKQVTVDWTTQELTIGDVATRNIDYTADNGTLTFEPGARTRTITVDTLTDNDTEPDEQLQVVLTNSQGAAITNHLGTGTILDSGIRELTIDNADPVVEGNDLIFTLTLSHARNQPTTPTIRVLGSNSTASSADHTFPSSKSVEIPATHQSVTFTVHTLEDELDEEAEVILLQVEAPAGTFNDGTPGVGVILDNDDTPTVSVAGPDTVIEGDFATFTVQLSEASGQVVSVYVATVDGTAGVPDDYSRVAHRIRFRPGTLRQTVTVTTVEDTDVEGDETFILQLEAPQDVTLDAAATTVPVTILDDDTGLSIADAPDVTEGDSLEFTVTLGQASSQPVTFDYTTVDGTATAPADYTTTSARAARIPAYTTTFTITVPTETDTESEGFEQLEVELSNASGAGIEDPIATGTINDPDLPNVLYGNPVVDVEEGEIAELTFQLDKPSTETIAIDVGTSIHGRSLAVPGIDFKPWYEIVTFKPGETEAVYYLETIDDVIDESTEAIVASIRVRTGSVQNATVSTTTLARIVDNDPPPVISVEGPSEVVEGEAAIFTLRLSEPSGHVTSVWVATVADTATEPTDFIRQAYRTYFRKLHDAVNPGEVEVVVVVPTVDDSESEGLESFSLRLRYPSLLRFDEFDDAVTELLTEVTIVDNDVAVNVGDTSAREGETLSFEVVLNAPSREVVTVEWETVEIDATEAGDAATAGDDYVAVVAGAVTIPAGQLSSTVEVVEVDSVHDELFEGDERFQVRLSNPRGAPLGDAVGVGKIVDDDTMVSVTGASAPEGAPVRFVVRLSEALSRPVTVDYNTEDLRGVDAATAGDDYVAVTGGKVTVLAGQTEAPLSIVTLSDDDDELDELFGLRLTSTSLGVLTADPTAEGVIVDGELPLLSVDDADVVIEGAKANFVLKLSAPSATDVVATVSTAAATGVEAATVDADFEQFDDDVTIIAGDTEASFAVTTLPDTRDEYDIEHFDVVVSLRADAAAVLVDNTATGRIEDDDATPTLSISAPGEVTEGDTVTVTLQLDEASDRPLTINYNTAGAEHTYGRRPATPTRVTCAEVPADARGDFEHTSGSVTIDAEDTTVTFNVTTCNDAITEVDGTHSRSSDGAVEAFTITATAPAGNAADATVNILDDEELPTLVIYDAAEVLEGDDLVFTLELSNPSELDTRVEEFQAGVTGDTFPEVYLHLDSLLQTNDTGLAYWTDYEFVSRPIWFTFPNTTAIFRIATVADYVGDRDREVFAFKPLITRNISDRNIGDDIGLADDPTGIGTIRARPHVGFGSTQTTTSGSWGNWAIEGDTVRMTVVLRRLVNEELTFRYWTEHSLSYRLPRPYIYNFDGRSHWTVRTPAQFDLDFEGILQTEAREVKIPANQAQATFNIEVFTDTERETIEHFRISTELLPGITSDGVTFGGKGGEGISIHDNEWRWVNPVLTEVTEMGAHVVMVQEGDSFTVTPTLSWYAAALRVGGTAPSGSPTAVADITMDIAAHPPADFPTTLQAPYTRPQDRGAAPADAGSDFTMPDQATIPIGGTYTSFEISTLDDSEIEGPECFFLELNAVSGFSTDQYVDRPYGLAIPYTKIICIEDND